MTITINKAIETNTQILNNYTFPLIPNGIDAIKLGIEALKRIIDFHEDDELLPGETKD